MSRDRDLGEVVTGTLSESSRGGSKSTTAGVGVGTGAAGNGSYQGFNFGALLGVSGGYGEANSSAWQDSARNLSSNSLQNLRDRTLQSASAVRGIRSTIVQTVSQGESVRATTEVVANHNHCHAMTVQYFEVLRHLKLQHELADVQECLFVPLPMSEFDLDKTLRWRQELRTYLQRPQLSRRLRCRTSRINQLVASRCAIGALRRRVHPVVDRRIADHGIGAVAALPGTAKTQSGKHRRRHGTGNLRCSQSDHRFPRCRACHRHRWCFVDRRCRRPGR